MKKYDAVVTLGSQPDTTTWNFPEQVYKCLDKAKTLLDCGRVAYVVTSGKWSITLDNIGLVQPFRECDVMADYLLSLSVSESKIIKEGLSKDTISNLYFLKTEIFIPRMFNKILFVAADFRIPRLEYLSGKILGDEYGWAFEPIAASPSSNYNEKHTLEVQKEFLRPMKDGDHAWLADKFYSAPMYEYWAKHDREKYSR
jgi:uncharacterized SAM-binding protein YcdF (DUF218 family)